MALEQPMDPPATERLMHRVDNSRLQRAFASGNFNVRATCGISFYFTMVYRPKTPDSELPYPKCNQCFPRPHYTYALMS